MSSELDKTKDQNENSGLNAESIKKPENPEPTSSFIDQPLPSSPVSQAVQDLTSDSAGPEPEPEPADKKPKLSSVKSFGWLLLMVPSLGLLVLWGAYSGVKQFQYYFPAIVLTLATLIATISTVKFLSLPSRSGLSCLGLALAFALTCLYNPEDNIAPFLSFPAVWAFILILVWLLVALTVIKTFLRSKRLMGVIILILLLYPLSSSGLSIYRSLTGAFSGPAETGLTLDILNHTPIFLTDKLSPFLWPQAILAILIPLLAAIIVFKRQFSRLLSKNSPKHLGGFFLGLGLLVLIVPGFMAFTPLSDKTFLAQKIRSVYPEAENYYVTKNAPSPPAVTNGQANPALTLGSADEAKPEPEIAPSSPETPGTPETPETAAPTVPLPPNTQQVSLETVPPPLAAGEIDNQTQPVSETGPAPGAVPDAAQNPPEVTTDNNLTTAAAQTPGAALGPAVSPAGTAESNSTVIPSPADSPAVVTPEAAPAVPAATAAAPDQVPPAGDQITAAAPPTESEDQEALKEQIEALTLEVESLEQENDDLSSRLQKSEAANNFLLEQIVTLRQNQSTLTPLR
jgi:hypothetical protein